MKYPSTPVIDPQSHHKVGVLLTNLGTPDAPQRGPVRRYLKEFLGDPRVVEFPRALWWLVLNGIILNVRPSRSAKAYRTVWTDEGSPLLTHTRDQACALAGQLAARYGDEVVVDYGMRYGSNNLTEGLDRLLAQGVTRVLVLPLFPQYSGSTVGSTWDAVAEHFRRQRLVPELRFVSGYHDQEDYIGALALKIRAFQAEHGQPDRLLFSYHGIPQRYADKGDPYYLQCLNTTRLVAEVLDLPEQAYMSCFQSRFGREPWLMPYTDKTLEALPGEGVKSVQVICPGFSADCLETIEEIGEENRDIFMEAGGEQYQFIPCLNSDDEHIAALATLAEEQLAGWVQRRLA